MHKIVISFDDGLIDQFKWARGLYRFGIKGTFYINPFFIGFEGFLSMEMIKKMHDEWGHTIANHFWLHESPKGGKVCPGPIDERILVLNLIKAREWLVGHGFGDGASLIALPFGSVGGGWTDEIVNGLKEYCEMIRDVGCGVNDVSDEILASIEDTKLIDAPDGVIESHYFHGNNRTRDVEFVKMLEDIDLLRSSGKVEVTSMIELSESKYANAI